MTWWVARTKTGRVVYDRPVKLFKWRDAFRIVKKLEVPDFIIEPKEYYDCWNTGLICIQKFKEADMQQIKRLIWQLNEKDVVGLFRSWIAAIEGIVYEIGQLSRD